MHTLEMGMNPHPETIRANNWGYFSAKQLTTRVTEAPLSTVSEFYT